MQPDTPDTRSARRVRSSILTLDALIIVTLALGATIVVAGPWTSNAADPAEPSKPSFAVAGDPVSLEGAHIKGTLTAPVGLLIFSDFECPFCQALAVRVMPQLESTYVDPGKVVVAYRSFPLRDVQASSIAPTLWAECAAEQGRFWQMHDQLFTAPYAFDDAILRTKGGDAGVDAEAVSACIENGTEQLVNKISSDKDAGRALGVTGTPYSLMGRLDADGRLRPEFAIFGSRSLESFAEVLDRLLHEPPLADANARR
jgi:protein-disulfide isomerase